MTSFQELGILSKWMVIWNEWKYTSKPRIIKLGTNKKPQNYCRAIPSLAEEGTKPQKESSRHRSYRQPPNLHFETKAMQLTKAVSPGSAFKRKKYWWSIWWMIGKNQNIRRWQLIWVEGGEPARKVLEEIWSRLYTQRNGKVLLGRGNVLSKDQHLGGACRLAQLIQLFNKHLVRAGHVLSIA